MKSNAIQKRGIAWLHDTQRASTYGPRFNIKMTSYQYRKSHCGDKTILRPSYLQNGISYTGKTTSLYWIRALVIVIMADITGSSFFLISLITAMKSIHKHFGKVVYCELIVCNFALLLSLSTRFSFKGIIKRYSMNYPLKRTVYGIHQFCFPGS